MLLVWVLTVLMAISSVRASSPWGSSPDDVTNCSFGARLGSRVSEHWVAVFAGIWLSRSRLRSNTTLRTHQNPPHPFQCIETHITESKNSPAPTHILPHAISG